MTFRKDKEEEEALITLKPKGTKKKEEKSDFLFPFT